MKETQRAEQIRARLDLAARRRFPFVPTVTVTSDIRWLLNEREVLLRDEPDAIDQTRAAVVSALRSAALAWEGPTDPEEPGDPVSGFLCARADAIENGSDW